MSLGHFELCASIQVAHSGCSCVHIHNRCHIALDIVVPLRGKYPQGALPRAGS